MRVFNRVCNEIRGSQNPGQLVPNMVVYRQLSLELTKKCTNRCDHCANNGSPEATRAMEKQLVYRLISEAKTAGFHTIALWGGEPFLHPDIDGIIREVFRQNMNLMITTNGFWGGSIAEAAAKLESITASHGELHLQLILSCDFFHQSQSATPIGNIPNIIDAVEKCNDQRVSLLLHGCNVENDNILQSLVADRWPGHVIRPGFIARLGSHSDRSKIEARIGPIDLTAGRAKRLPSSMRSSRPLNRNVLDSPWPLFGNVLYVGANRRVYCDSHTVGSDIFSIGSVDDLKLRQVIDRAHGDVVVRMLSTMPFSRFLAYFAGKIDLDPLIGGSHSINELFNRLYYA